MNLRTVHEGTQVCALGAMRATADWKEALEEAQAWRQTKALTEGVGRVATSPASGGDEKWTKQVSTTSNDDKHEEPAQQA